MNDGLLGIEFSETMSGYFHWGANEPAAGAALGEKFGHTLTVRSAISIADVDAFCSPEQVPADLLATVDLHGSTEAPAVRGARAELGSFRLFVPAAYTSLMIYRFGLSIAGQPYFFQGMKTLYGESSVRRLWRQSTHLYSRLHRGRDARGEVVGAGVLTIGARGTWALARSTRTVGVGSRIDRARALARYNRYNLQGFWRALRQGPMAPAPAR